MKTETPTLVAKVQHKRVAHEYWIFNWHTDELPELKEDRMHRWYIPKMELFKAGKATGSTYTDRQMKTKPYMERSPQS